MLIPTEVTGCRYLTGLDEEFVQVNALPGETVYHFESAWPDTATGRQVEAQILLPRNVVSAATAILKIAEWANGPIASARWDETRRQSQ